ncbi:hypothetical protein BDZ45DRAFT_724596 [Acephala macrosclerotiorum]|nr:hypothetical protein BDZ45DRAFT_724596 [Acephala macrosclerotiorum]
MMAATMEGQEPAPGRAANTATPLEVNDDADGKHSSDDNNAGDFTEKEFTLFPKLPIELRLKVWEDAASKGQLIHIKAKGLTRGQRPSTVAGIRVLPGLSGLFSVKSIGYRVPAVLQANHESRTVAKKKYKVVWAHRRKGQRILVNFDCDTLVFAKSYDMILLTKVQYPAEPEQHELKYAVLKDELRYIAVKDWGSYIIDHMSYFGNLVKVAIPKRQIVGKMFNITQAELQALWEEATKKHRVQLKNIPQVGQLARAEWMKFLQE